MRFGTWDDSFIGSYFTNFLLLLNIFRKPWARIRRVSDIYQTLRHVSPVRMARVMQCDATANARVAQSDAQTQHEGSHVDEGVTCGFVLCNSRIRKPTRITMNQSRDQLSPHSPAWQIGQYSSHVSVRLLTFSMLHGCWSKSWWA